MKHLLNFLFICVLLVSCNQTEPIDDPNTNDTTTNQPANPAAFSLVGKKYISETTYEYSPAEDRYWVWVLDFFSKDSVVKYETPNRDLTYHNDYMQRVDSTRYKLNYPNITYYSLAGFTTNITIIDTTSLYLAGLDITYSLIHN